MTMHSNMSDRVAEAASSGANKNPRGQSTSTQPEQPQKKGKDKKIWSCHSCRRRKLKCDRSDPCGACQARGEGHSCTWEEGQRPEKNNRESLEQLPSLIQKLTQEVKELKTSNSELMESIRYKNGAASSQGLPATLGTAPEVGPWVERAPFLTMCFPLPQGSDPPYQKPDRKRWTHSRVAALLPESTLLRGLISHFLHASAPLTGFIDVSHLLSEVEEVEQVRKGIENQGPLVSVEHFDLKVSLVLASASLGTVNLDAVKAEELGISRANVDAVARDLWKKARFLIAHLDLDFFTAGSEASMSALPRAQPSLSGSPANIQQTASASTSTSMLLLRIVAIKILLLLTARSFAASSEYLKLHLDTVSSAVEASLDSLWDDEVPLEEREWRWQLWSFLCALDWTSPGIYHNGSYFIRPEMHSDPPSRVPGAPDDGTYSPMMETEHSESLSQTRYFLEHLLDLASLSRRAEDCIIRPGPISPPRAADLCTELDALDHKLSFYQLLGGGAGREAEGSGPNNSVSSSVGARVRANGSGGSHTLNEHQVPLQKALQMQNVLLSLELGIIRFKLFRHEAFHLMQDATTPGPLRTMCMDTCMDACILVLSHCRNIGVSVPTMGNLAAEEMRNSVTDHPSGANKEKRRIPGIFRRVIQPASSAAIVGQVLLHASQSADALDQRTNTSRPMSRAGINSSTSGNSANDFYPYAERSMESLATQHFANGNGSASWTGGSGREKVSILQWHINAVIAELEALQSTSPLARGKLVLHRQCM